MRIEHHFYLLIPCKVSAMYEIEILAAFSLDFFVLLIETKVKHFQNNQEISK